MFLFFLPGVFILPGRVLLNKSEDLGDELDQGISFLPGFIIIAVPFCYRLKIDQSELIIAICVM